MKLFTFKNSLIALAAVTVLSACRKNNVTPEEPVLPGIYVLNQGNIGKNNSTLSFYNLTTNVITPNQFSVANGAGLGDTGNDIKVYGSKMYITVNYSSTVEVVDKKTAKSIKQIKLFNGSTARQPRYVVFNKNKAFISSYDGTVAVLDTTTLTVDKYINVGRNPEQMVISNNKLYVANSGGLDMNFDYDKSVSVIDLTTLTETKKIIVPANPIAIAADAYGDVYVLSYPDYLSSPKFTIINNTTDVVKSSVDFNLGYATPFVISGDIAYYVTGANKIGVYDVKNDVNLKTDFVTDGTTIKAPYGITVSDNGNVLISDAINYSSDGTLFIFDKTGKKQNSFAVGINPGAILIVNK